MSHSKTIVIIGGGVSGLAAAFQAQSSLPDASVILLEANDRVGGVLQTEKIQCNGGEYLIEQSADMFVSDPPSAMQLIEQLGKTDQLLRTKPTIDRAYVATKDLIHPVPRGLSLMLPNKLEAVLKSPLLDEAAKRRFAQERDVVARSSDEDESLESFAVRRFGQSVFEQLIQPLVSGIYTADPKKLSMHATMARFVEMEREHGSLIRAAEFANAKNKKPLVVASENADNETSGARYGLFRAPEKGMSQLVGWIVDALKRTTLRTSCKVEAVVKKDSKWSIQFRTGHANDPETIQADGLVLATPARVSAKVLSELDGELSGLLSTIKAASSAIVVLGLDQRQFSRQFDGYGIIVPSVLNRNVIATSFASNKFEGRTGEGKVLIRSFIGGALQPELVELDDCELIKLATEELERTVGFSGEPELSRVYRWRNCMPQYHLGHLQRVSKIEALVSSYAGLELAGNSYHGVGIPACIESGFEAIGRLVKALNHG
ncbi:MAG: protoporphyrinogen oxidase [Mariniblastus sp.]|nr:protoporphyrinogen oxidase [Mariniblastus sp.]